MWPIRWLPSHSSACGGLDSTLALLVACKAFDTLGKPRTGIKGLTMPGFGTTGRTRKNADRLAGWVAVIGVQIKQPGRVESVALGVKSVTGILDKDNAVRIPERAIVETSVRDVAVVYQGQESFIAEKL